MRSHKNLKRVPTVSSIADNKSSKFLHNGANKSGTLKGYSFVTVAKKDNKAMEINKNMAMSDYRKAIQGTLKVLDGANR